VFDGVPVQTLLSAILTLPMAAVLEVFQAA